MFQRNLTHGPVRNGDGHPPLRSARPDLLPVPLPGPNSFSLSDMGRDGFRLALAASGLLLGLGTTGSKVVLQLIHRLLHELGQSLLPASVNYLMIDADQPPAGTDPAHFLALPGTGAGSGTDPREGRRKIDDPRTHAQLRGWLSAAIDAMQARVAAELMPALPARQVVNLMVISGPGGTSAGTVDRVIAVAHDAAQARHVHNLLVHHVQIGAELPLNDRTRSTCPEQEEMVRATAAAVLAKAAGDLITDGLIEERRPNGSTFLVPAGRRVHSLSIADQDNGRRQCATVDALAGVLADALFVRIFTAAGPYLAARILDADELGVLARGKHQRETHQ
jgi:hypothetical protein